MYLSRWSMKKKGKYDFRFRIYHTRNSMRRVFVCGHFNFPRGGATSNYIQYFGAALTMAGNEVHLITTKNKEYCQSDEYKGIHIHEIKFDDRKIASYIDFKTGLKNKIITVLQQLKPTSKDIIVIYSHNLWLHKALQKYGRENCVKVGSIVVEYFSSEDYKNGRFDLEYIKNRFLNLHVIPYEDFVFPISSYICDKFSNGIAKQMVLPIMADPYEFQYIPKEVCDTKRFIFPANGKMKDALCNMVLAIMSVLKNEQLDVEFHFCGIKEKDLRRYANLNQSQTLDKRIIIHKWLEYDELVELYKKMHFLLLARDVTEMTKANFPSKVPELMCYGVVPIVSRVGDYTKYYLENGKDCIVMNGSSVSIISDAIYYGYHLTNEQYKRMSNNARKLAEDRFWYGVWAEKIDTFMEKLYGNS